MASISKKSIFNLSKAFPHRASSIFIGRQIWKGAATEEAWEQQSRKLYGTDSDETGGKVSEMAADKAKEVKDKATKTTQDAWKAIEDTAQELKEKVVGNIDPEKIVVEDEKDLKKKLAKEAGGKPVDEDKGLNVNWRPIVEKKPQPS
ncbi:hypothetical protein KY290_014542 [Solanum tuberosum]|uniref:Uncharacterized protein n=2 Tax=Solanum tuberosum TaxID=4113 RepID=A0ABQ7VPX5_SOLTU|nr:PREDICTED: uncharacterized protein LOC102584927 isoform X1 [Solanum tuberosum]KAH0770561.1 hypothetical protein KY290_014542 [Solanum tuberosum]